MKLRKLLALLPMLSAMFALKAVGEVTLPNLWRDHAVVQRDLPVRVWGRSAAGEHVTVRFRDQTAQVVADDLGLWQASLPPGGAGGPFTMEVEGTNHLVLHDLMVGDVWVASGQSNMEFATSGVMNAAEELKHVNDARIRLFHVERASADFRQYDVTTKGWTEANSTTVADFSAVAYFFARQIAADQNVTVGLVEADWGGTPGETWISNSALASDAALLPAWSTWAAMTDKEDVMRLQVAREERETKAALAAGKPAPAHPWHPELRSFLPGGAFNGMIAPLTQFPIRGVLWYQGESNAGKERWFYYHRLFQTLIEDWRTRWNVGDFPFLYVQLANFTTAADGKWPELREAQRQTLNVSNTGMAVAIDIGDPDNIHPRNKQEVGRRLSLAARAIAYHEPIEYSGPLYLTSMPQAGAMRVVFTHGNGLKVKGSGLQGFEVAGEDGNFVPAEARIEGEYVIASSRKIAHPVAVRYGWAGNPSCNLYNADDLPASPFNSLPPSAYDLHTYH